MTPPLILVVDDDAGVRRLMKQTLEREGFRVLLGENGTHALDMLTTEPFPPDLLLADVVMPSMGGVDLALKLLATPKPPKVILMSGFGHDMNSLRVGTYMPPFFRKPFNPLEIVKRIRQDLGIAS